MRYVQVNTGKGEVEPRITGIPMEADLPGPMGNKVGGCVPSVLLVINRL